MFYVEAVLAVERFLVLASGWFIAPPPITTTLESTYIRHGPKYNPLSTASAQGNGEYH